LAKTDFGFLVETVSPGSQRQDSSEGDHPGRRGRRYPSSGRRRPPIADRIRISPEEYEKERKKFYRMAAELGCAREMDLAEIFMALHGNFGKAKKPLNFIARHFLAHKAPMFF
jgi:hypothetical protein